MFDIPGTSSTISRLLVMYKEIMNERTFESYEARAEDIDQLYDHLKLGIAEEEKWKLHELTLLHEQIISMILLEKANLGEQFLDFNKKKHVSNQYGKVSSYDGVDAFFLDYKK